MSEGFGLDPRFFPIAFTGGDVGGKSTIMPIAKKYLEEQGMRVAIHAEAASEIISAGFSPIDKWLVGGFQEHLLLYILEREETYYKMLTDIDTEAPLVLLCDRGSIDAKAYMSQNAFEQLTLKHGLHPFNLRERYKAVVHLVTAANGAEEAYLASVGNNPGRIQRTPEEARELDQLTIKAWEGHPHHHIIDNSTNFPGKIKRALSALRRVLPMPKAIEQERKFLVLKRGAMPARVGTMIYQVYLTSPEGVERRVRQKTQDGARTFYYTEKRPTETLGAREEDERQITREEFDQLFKERDPATQEVSKLRETYVYGNLTFEHDRYLAPEHVNGLEIVEIENVGPTDEIVFPPGYEVQEVTGQEQYSNHSIALGYPLPF
jgi:CYTH domain-containing protein